MKLGRFRELTENLPDSTNVVGWNDEEVSWFEANIHQVVEAEEKQPPVLVLDLGQQVELEFELAERTGIDGMFAPGEKDDEEDFLVASLGTDYDPGEASDGHHTFNELYRYRLLYNAALFNEWATLDRYDVHKSTLHSDGKLPFGSVDWFIVVAELPTGQISNHYKIDDWDLFRVPVKDLANEYDGHNPADVAVRLENFLRGRVLLTGKFLEVPDGGPAAS